MKLSKNKKLIIAVVLGVLISGLGVYLLMPGAKSKPKTKSIARPIIRRTTQIPVQRPSTSTVVSQITPASEITQQKTRALAPHLNANTVLEVPEYESSPKTSQKLNLGRRASRAGSSSDFQFGDYEEDDEEDMEDSMDKDMDMDMDMDQDIEEDTDQEMDMSMNMN